MKLFTYLSFVAVVVLSFMSLSSLCYAENLIMRNPDPSHFAYKEVFDEEGEGQIVFIEKGELKEKARPVSSFSPYKREEMLIQLKKGVRTQHAIGMLSSRGLTVAKRFRHLSALLGKEILLVRGTGKAMREIRKILRESNLVDATSPNYAKRLFFVDGDHEGIIPDDPSFSLQWALYNTGQEVLGQRATVDADIDATDAWGIQTGSDEVVIAVLDTGVDYLHPDLLGNMWKNSLEAIGVPGIDDDGNGYIDDIYGIDTGENDSDPMDSMGHGTHVAGIIAAIGNNGIGVCGINWDAKIMAIKGFASDGLMYSDAELEALDYILAMKQAGVNIVAVNASWGCTNCESTLEKQAIEALGKAGIVLVAAAGNSSIDNDLTPQYPASYDLSNVVSVAATDISDDLCSFSNYGADTVDLGAPGYYVLSTYMDYIYFPSAGDLFYDNMDSGPGSWISDGNWALTTQAAFSWPYSWTDSPGGNYQNNQSTTLISPTINLIGQSKNKVFGFRLRYDLEKDSDFLTVSFWGPVISSWKRTIERAYSGAFAWSDSPWRNYDSNSDNWLVSPIVDISDADDQVDVSFWLFGNAEAGWDYLDVYISADGGENWSYRGSVTGNYQDRWHQFSIGGIPAKYRTSHFRLAFVLDSDGDINQDGYYIDDVMIKDDQRTFFFDDMEQSDGDWAKSLYFWHLIKTITGSSEGHWPMVNFPIPAKFYTNQFKVKFTLQTNASVTDDGVYIDNVGIGIASMKHVLTYMSGTSMAAPHVTGAIGLLAAHDPSEGMEAIIDHVLSGVDPIPALQGKTISGGRLNLYNALYAVKGCRADLDDDKDVDLQDLAIFVRTFGSSDITNPEDIDKDLDFDGLDLFIMADQFGRNLCQ